MDVIERTAESHKQAIADHFSKKTEYWDVVYNPNNPATGRSLIQQVNMTRRKAVTLSFISKYQESNKGIILDIGCGAGVLMSEILEMGHDVKGVDISEKMVETVNTKLKAKNNSPICFNAAVESLPFPNNYFDVITCLGVFEYLLYPEKGLDEIYRVLKNNGILIISAPNLLKLQYVLDPYYYMNRGLKYFMKKRNKSKLGTVDKDISTNRNFTNKRFTFNFITKLMSKCNFNLLEFENIGYGPLTFWRRNLAGDSAILKVNGGLVKLSHNKLFSLLKYFSNRWVFCLKKTII